MPAATPPHDEQQRLAELRRLAILDSAPEQDYDDLTSLAAAICQTPTALISLVDAKRQWFKSRLGFAPSETSRDISFCAHAIHQQSVLVVPDAQSDVRFADNPLVVGDPQVRFYAGAPLHTRSGYNIGTLCVLDEKPRTLGEEQKQALQALARQVVRLIELRHRNRIMESLVENTPAAMAIKDDRGQIIYVNRYWKRFFGHSDEEPAGRNVQEWFGGETGQRILAGDQEALRKGEVIENVERLGSNEGERTWLTLRFPLEGMESKAIVGGVRFDLTRTLYAEERWRQSEEKFRELCRSATDAIITVTEEGEVVFWNPSAEKIYGYGAEEIDRQHYRILVHPADLDRFLDSVRRNVPLIHVSGLRKDGSSFPAEVSISRWSDEQHRYITAIVRDLTERRMIESQLEQARRTESLGRVAATVAHEFNNVLMGVSVSIAALKKSSDERMERVAVNISRSVERGKAVTEQILRYARPQEPLLEPVDLSAWLQALGDELRSIATEKVALEIVASPQPVRASCDRHQLEQVVTNLVANARDAVGHGGKVVASIELRSHCPEVNAPGVRCARLTVADNGQGIPPQILSQIFEPLFTTKRTGTGIGLSVAQRIIEKHGGLITVRSEVGQGSDFTIHLPAID